MACAESMDRDEGTLWMPKMRERAMISERLDRCGLEGAVTPPVNLDSFLAAME